MYVCMLRVYIVPKIPAKLRRPSLHAMLNVLAFYRRYPTPGEWRMESYVIDDNHGELMTVLILHGSVVTQTVLGG